MRLKLTALLRNPWLLFIFFFIIIFLLDSWFGDVNYNPTAWLSHVWFAELIAGILIGVIVMFRRGHLVKYIQWLFLAAALTLLSGYVLYSNQDWYRHPPDQYNNLVGSSYDVLENMLPYTGPFHQVEKDYSLFSDVPEFIRMQQFIILPLVSGYVTSYAIQRLRKSHSA